MKTAGSQSVSIIVPTFHEANNIPELIKRIAQLDFGSYAFEVILMDDDSRDGTEEAVYRLRSHYPWLRLIIRKGKKGLSEAVLDGFEQANYSTWVVMDADLSHPPEKIPEMLAALDEPQIEFVIGSRYVKGGSSDEAWPLLRKLCSRLAAFIARVLVAVPVKDPLSGFLAVKKSTVMASKKIEPIGWKIGLELMVKCGCKHIKEVPIHFAQRTQGVSKLSLKVMIAYVKHVKRLVWFRLISSRMRF